MNDAPEYIYCGHCDVEIDGRPSYIPECCDKPICSDCIEQHEASRAEA